MTNRSEIVTIFFSFSFFFRWVFIFPVAKPIATLQTIVNNAIDEDQFHSKKKKPTERDRERGGKREPLMRFEWCFLLYCCCFTKSIIDTLCALASAREHQIAANLLQIYKIEITSEWRSALQSDFVYCQIVWCGEAEKTVYI